MIYGYDEENGEPIQPSYENESRVEQIIAEEDNENQDNEGNGEMKEEVMENNEGEEEDGKQGTTNDIVEETQNEDKEEDESTVVPNDNESSNLDDQESGKNDEETENNNKVQGDADDNDNDVDDDDDEMEENTEEEERARNEGNSTVTSRLSKLSTVEVSEFKYPTKLNSNEMVDEKEKLRDTLKITQDFIDREILFSSGQNIEVINTGDEGNENKSEININKEFIGAEKQIGKEIENTRKYKDDDISATREILRNEIAFENLMKSNCNNLGNQEEAIQSVKPDNLSKKQKTNLGNQNKLVKFADTVTVIHQNNDNESDNIDRSKLNQVIKLTEEFLYNEKLFASGISPDQYKANTIIDRDIITATQTFLQAEKLYASEQYTLMVEKQYETDIIKCTRDFLEKEIQYADMMRTNAEICNTPHKSTTKNYHCEDDDCVYYFIDEEKCLKESVNKQVNNEEGIEPDTKDVTLATETVHNNSAQKGNVNTNVDKLEGKITSVKDSTQNEDHEFLGNVGKDVSRVIELSEIHGESILNENTILMDGTLTGIQNLLESATENAKEQTEQGSVEVVEDNVNTIKKKGKDMHVRFLDVVENEIDKIKSKMVHKRINKEENSEKIDNKKENDEVSRVEEKVDNLVTNNGKSKQNNKIKDKNKSKLGKISNFKSRIPVETEKQTSRQHIHKLPDEHNRKESDQGSDDSINEINNETKNTKKKRIEDRKKFVDFKPKHLPLKNKKNTTVEIDKFHKHEDVNELTNIQTEQKSSLANNTTSNYTGSEHLGSKRNFSTSASKQTYSSGSGTRKLDIKEKYISREL